MRRAGLLVLFVLAVAVAVPASATDVTPVTDPAEIVRGAQERTGVPGIAWAVVNPDRIQRFGVRGVDGDGERITRETAFVWGSVSKPVLATVVTGLAEDGKLRLDQPVHELLPGFRLRDAQASRRITVRMLLQHTAGLPAGTALLDRYDGEGWPTESLPTLEEVTTNVLPALAKMSAVSPPGKEYHYSSLGYFLLTAVVERVEQESYESSAALGLGVGTVGAPPRGHRYVFGQPVAMTTPEDSTGVGYGYAAGDLNTLAEFARFNLGDVFLPGFSQSPVISPAQRREMQTGGVATGGGQFYGLGWRRSPLRAVDIRAPGEMVWHAGAAPGYQAFIALLPDRKRAVVVLQNAYGRFQEKALLDLGFALVASQVGASPPVKPDTNPRSYWVVLAVGVIGVVVLLVLVLRAIRRLRRPSAPARSALGLVALGILAVALGVVLPRLFEIRLTQITLWAPDVGWLVYIMLALCALLAVLMVARMARPAAGRLARRLPPVAWWESTRR